jgi:transposase
VRDVRVWRVLLGVERAVVERVELGVGGQVIAHVRVAARWRSRCGVCVRRCGGYDGGRGRRRWRGLDLGTARVFLEAESPRVRCAQHGVVVAHVPWARHDAGHTRSFDDTVAWLAVRTSKAAVTQLMRVAWRTVGSIIARVWRERSWGLGDRLDGLRRIGVDEVSHRRGHRYLTLVVDHDTGRLVWAAPGRTRATLREFFDALGPARSALLTHVSADGADWIAEVVSERCPQAVRCADAFHVVAWATDALDEVRRQAWNDARRGGPTISKGRGRRDADGPARRLKHARWALWKNPEHLTDRQRHKLDWIAKTDPRLYRAYLLKEGLRSIFAVKGQAGKQALHRWLSWARRCRIPAFVNLYRRIKAHRNPIEATLEHHLSNARIESVNTKIRLLTRIAFGFHTPQALIAIAMLSLGGCPPQLPHQTHPHL